MNTDAMKRKLIKKAKLKTISDTEKFIESYIQKMNYSQLKTTEKYVIDKQKKDGINDGNSIFLSIVQERLKKFDK